MYILESSNAKLLDEHKNQKGYSASDANPPAAPPAAPPASGGSGSGSGSPTAGDYSQYAQQTMSVIDSATGAGSNTNGCIKPHFYAGSSAWAAYNICMHKNDPPKPEAFYWPTESEFPQTAWSNLLASSDTSDAQVILLGTALERAKWLMTEYLRQHQYHIDHPTATSKDDAGITLGWANKATDFANQLGSQILKLRPNSAGTVPQTCSAGYHWDVAAKTCVADSNIPPVVNKKFWGLEPMTAAWVYGGGAVLLIAGVLYYGHAKLDWFKKA